MSACNGRSAGGGAPTASRCLLASAIRGSPQFPPEPPLVRREYGRVRTPLACRRPRVCVHRSAAGIPPGRYVGKWTTFGGTIASDAVYRALKLARQYLPNL